ncbi:MAG: efflux RND transporter periplasmic adaptor subunit [Deltaproteobacteria bacterium]|nr:efflux RND transporter periplasmic adaptor subunit [Deltaproteobacteria bacterium]
MNAMRLCTAIAAVALIGGAAGCAEEPPPAEPVVRPIKMLTVGTGANETREYPGRLRAAQQADMAFEVPGRIISFVYREGDRVKEGGVLARLDPSDYENQLEQALAVERNRRTYLSRIAQAHKTGAVSDQDLNDAQAQVDVAAAETKIAQKAVNDTRLRAPFDGVMSRKLVEDFANVQAKQAILIFEDPAHMEIKVSVPERDLAGRRATQPDRDAINERLRPEVMVTSLPDVRFPARLKELATTADPTTRTFEATFTFEPGEHLSVLPGMTAKVTVHPGDDLGTVSDVAIPATAATADEEGRASVWIVDTTSGAVSRRLVTLGDLSGDEVIVTQGLNDGDTVAVSGVVQLREGMKVRRWER